MTVDEVKTLLRICNTLYDAYLTAIIPLAIEYAQRYCNRDFKNEQGQLVLPGGVKIAIAKICQFHMRDAGVQSEALARHNVTFATEYPKEVTTLLNVYRRPSFV